MQYAPLGNAEMLADELLRASAWYAFFDARELPRTDAEFEARLTQQRSHWPACFETLLEHMKAIMAARFARRSARWTMRNLRPTSMLLREMKAQVVRLVPADFLDRVPLRHLGEVPRYLEAIAHRLDGLQGRIAKDAQASREIADFETRLTRVGTKLGARDDLDDHAF